MKDLIEKLFRDKSTELTGALEQKAGFSAAEALKFLPAVLDKLKGLLGDGKLDLAKLADLSALKGKFDLSALAKLAGIDVGKAGTGLDVVLRKVEDLAGKETGGLAGMLGKAGKLFGR